MAVVEAQTSLAVRVERDMHDLHAAYEMLWNHEIPGFIIPPGIVKGTPNHMNMVLGEESAAWLSLAQVGRHARFQSLGENTDPDIGVHASGDYNQPQGLQWRTRTIDSGEGSLFMATLKPEFLQGIIEQIPDAMLRQARMMQLLQAAKKNLLYDGVVDDEIFYPDAYIEDLEPGDSVTYRAVDGFAFEPAAYEFRDTGLGLMTYYQTTAIVDAPVAATIEPHGKLLEGTQPAV